MAVGKAAAAEIDASQLDALLREVRVFPVDGLVELRVDNEQGAPCPGGDKGRAAQ